MISDYEFDFVRCSDGFMVTKYHGSSECPNIPDSIKGVPVTTIGEYVFCDMQDAGIELVDARIIDQLSGSSKIMKKICIPRTVKKISSAAFFGCTLLEEIIIPEETEYIGSAAFSGCGKLKKINLPFGLKAINAGLFRGCEELCNVEIPSSVECIEHLAFNGCKSLDKIKLPMGLEKIGAMAFQGCSSLRSIEIPENVKSIGQGVFAESGLIECTVRAHISELPSAMFLHCNRLEKVILSSEIEEIGANALEFCDSLSTISYIGE